MKHNKIKLGIKQLFILKSLFCIIALNGQTPSYKGSPTPLDDAFWAFCVQDAETGETVVDIRSHHLMTPASTLKTYTTGTLLSMRQSQDRLPTYLCSASKPTADGVLNGDLYIIGSGDPTIGSRFLYGQDKFAFFKDAVASLKRHGINRINGNIIAYSPESDFQGANPYWPFYDLGNYYAAGAYDLNLFDNSFEIKFTNYGRNFTTNPTIEDLKLVKGYDISNRMYADSLYVAMVGENPNERVITGVYPASRKTLTIRSSIPNPPLFFAQYLTNYLRRNGISIQGKAETAKQISKEQVRDTLFTSLSPTLFQIAHITNIYSHNLFAEALMKQIGRGVTPIAGENAMQTSIREASRYWIDRGLPTKDELKIYDGCGLAPHNKISAAFLATMLGKIYRGDPSHTFMNTLPIAGKEGTLAFFLKKTPLEGNARLKSGTIRYVKSYAGYVMPGDGKVYTVAILVNNHGMKGSVLTSALENVLLETFGYQTVK